MPNWADGEGRYHWKPPKAEWHEAVEIPHSPLVVHKRCNCAFCVHERPGKYADFYTDMGEVLVVYNKAGERFSIGRYGVWIGDSRGKAQVAETFETLEELKKNYGDLKEVFQLRHIYGGRND
jgi:hypothetical protein